MRLLKIIALTLCGACLASATQATLGANGPSIRSSSYQITNNGLYFSGGAGGNVISGAWDKTLKSGFTANAGMGYQYSIFRIDATATWLTNKYETGNKTLNNVAFLGNAYINLPLPNDFIPYIGGGAGEAVSVTDKLTSKGSYFAYQGIAGLGYRFSTQLTFSFSYHFLGIDINNAPDQYNNLFNLQMAYRF